MQDPAVVAILKAELVDRIGTGTLTTHAMLELGIRHETLKQWIGGDPDFANALAAAQEHLTEMRADSLVDLHEHIPDARRAQVASRNLTTWLGWRNPKKFGRNTDDGSTNAGLLDVLREAIKRIQKPAERPIPLIEQRPTRDMTDAD